MCGAEALAAGIPVAIDSALAVDIACHRARED